ncbi:dienelactone hydrolase [Erythrobacter sp. JK5]|uniref:alpha/beta hydrolase family protein n=1 Tax=Erythrobacter sp. JK5 TaxID=2829500 RepID=UPI001BA63A95|nr:dienelactone hydrolase [Erythrobacter sp. JK5]QUL36939.1 dienelactone hydrolase [Erythrobacter sp. JK5]
MKKRHIALAALGVLAVGAGTAAYVATPTVHEGAPGETPELGRFGDYTVGTSLLEMTLPDRVTFGALGMATGQTETGDRVLDVRLYYPAVERTGTGAVAYTHTMDPPDMEPVTLDYQGRALDGAEALAEGQFPLVIMSHGFNGWSTQFSNLAEHIASRGYVVASIDHADMKLEGTSDFVLSFSRVLASRSLDQRQVLAQILAASGEGAEGPFALIDPEQVGLIGYSMGGYGALATAGADYDYESGTFATVPGDALAPLRAVAGEDAGIDAVVAFAPWGGQPDNRVWSSETLSRITAPVLIVSGGQDDVSNHAEGVSWIFDQLTGTSRHMLVFREARHNIVGNAFAMPEDAPFRAIEFVSEPVWRQDRINGINQHFVAAFLDLHLKGDADKAAYLDVPTTDANAGTWETGFGEQLNGKFAGSDEPDHWRGFQKRWAAGLDLFSKKAGE